jgi:hypothetical protein
MDMKNWNAALADVPKLFSVWTTGIVNGFHLPIEWIAFRHYYDVSPNMPWAAIIEGYDAANPPLYAMSGVAEKFTEAEASALVEYLKRTDPEGAPITEPVELPISCSFVSAESWVGAGCKGFIFSLSKQKHYNQEDYGLPFEVGGFCRLKRKILIREEKSGGFVVYMDGTSISTPFADLAAAEAWKVHMLPMKEQMIWDSFTGSRLKFESCECG